jgi:hypothetical protein
MVDEPGKTLVRTMDPSGIHLQLSHIHILAKPKTRTHTDRDEMAVIGKGKHFRPLGHSEHYLNIRH